MLSTACEILLIDDDADFCESVKLFFAGNNLPLLTITDPRLGQALDYSKVKLVLLDFDMPIITGLDILNEIRKSQKPIIIMVSGHSDERTRLECLRKGADFFFSKPVNLEELRLVVLRALGRTEDIDPKGNVWTLNRSRLQLTTPDGRRIGLTSSEFRLLEVLIARTPNEATKEELSEAATGRRDSTTGYNRALEVMLSRIRSRASSGDVRLPVKSLRNIGYVFHGAGKIED